MRLSPLLRPAFVPTLVLAAVSAAAACLLPSTSHAEEAAAFAATANAARVGR
jgi:hypothetical protein